MTTQDYATDLEKRISELDDIIKQQSLAINNYKMIVKFEVRLRKDEIVLTMNNGTVNHIFAHATQDLYKQEWKISYENPFIREFSTERRTICRLNHNKLREIYYKLNLNAEFGGNVNEHQMLLIYLIKMTNTDNVLFDQCGNDYV